MTYTMTMTMTMRMRMRMRFLSLLICATMLAACAPRAPLQQPATQVIPDFPLSYYLQAEAQGKKVLRVDAAHSLLVFEVRRAGALARFGHDHVVASHDVNGFVAPDEGRADLYVPLDHLVVDEEALRDEAGFSPQPSQEDIAGTRRNMLSKVLQTERFPTVLIHLVRKDGAASVLTVAITLHGVTRSFDVPVEMRATSDGIVASGTMHFNQTDFGIVPFSLLGGALQVQDRVDMRFRIFADR